MPRKGRAFEKIITELEELGSLGLQIKSPDFINDNITGEPREVDISIRGKLNSYNILIVIECRDRKAKQGVEWIEQIDCKTKDIGANKVIAVSSSGFTKNAKIKAKVKNIQLNTFEEFSPKTVIDLLNIQNIENIVYHFDIKEVHVCLNLDDNNFQKILKEKPGCLKEAINPTELLGSKLFFSKVDKKYYSVLDIWNFIFDKNYKQYYQDIIPNSPKELRKKTIHFQKGDQGFQFFIDDLPIDMICLDIEVELWIETFITPISQFWIYQTEKDVIAKIHRFKIPPLGHTAEMIIKNT